MASMSSGYGAGTMEIRTEVMREISKRIADKQQQYEHLRIKLNEMHSNVMRAGDDVGALPTVAADVGKQLTVLRERLLWYEAELEQIEESSILREPTLPAGTYLLSLMKEIENNRVHLDRSIKELTAKEHVEIDKQERASREFALTKQEIRDKSVRLAEKTPASMVRECDAEINTYNELNSKIVQLLDVFLKENYADDEQPPSTPILKKKGQTTGPWSLRKMLLELKERSRTNPDDPYIMMDPLLHRQTHIELLLRCQLIDLHPNDSRLMRMVNLAE